MPSAHFLLTENRLENKKAVPQGTAIIELGKRPDRPVGGAGAILMGFFRGKIILRGCLQDLGQPSQGVGRVGDRNASARARRASGPPCPGNRTPPSVRRGRLRSLLWWRRGRVRLQLTDQFKWLKFGPCSGGWLPDYRILLDRRSSRIPGRIHQRGPNRKRLAPEGLGLPCWSSSENRR